MASRVKNSIEIDRPVGVVFGFVDDFRNTTRYQLGMPLYEARTKKTHGVGATFDVVKKISGMPDMNTVLEITEWQKNKKIAFESISGFKNGGRYTFDAKGQHTAEAL